MSEPPHKPVRRRRPTLSAALKAAQKAGRQVRSAVERDRVVLTFGDDASAESSTNEWDEALGRGKH
jgi:hypothetical protein